MANSTDIKLPSLTPLPPLPYDDLSQSQIKAIAIISKFSGILSVWGSIYIIFDIIGNHGSREERLKNAYYRIMLGLSISDCVISFSAYVLSTWPLPNDYVHDNLVWGNVGNRGTCQAQGFMVQFWGFCSAYYTAMLTFHFLLYIKYQWKEADFRKIEPYLHVAIWSCAFISAAIPVFKDLYNPEMMFCYIQSYPYGCHFADGFECINGDNLSIYLWSLFFIPVMICFIIITTSLSILVLHTWKQEKRIMRLSQISSQQNHDRESRRLTKIVYRRASKYVLSFIFIWSPEITFLVSEHFFHLKGKKLMYTLLVLMGIISPLQGLLNAMIYTHTNLCGFSKKTISLLFPGNESLPTFEQNEDTSSELG